MGLRHLGTSTKQGGSPSLYLVDDTSYVVVGWPTHEHAGLEIPHDLLGSLRPGTCLGVLLHDTGHGTFTFTGGLPVTDPGVLSEMKPFPAYEAAVKVRVAIQRRPDDEPTAKAPVTSDRVRDARSVQP
jgi:hypothetical protein